MNFEIYNTIYYKINANSEKKYIAAFDMDYTLIKPKSNNVFPKDENDWKLLFGNKIIEKLKKIKKDYQIIIFTNQKGLSKGKTTIEQLSKKMYDIQTLLDIDIDVIISTTNDYYRKPLTGMWRFYKSHRNTEIDRNKSFYVGDAAGRIYTAKLPNSKTKKDHSSDDRFFAHNIKLQFYTPEQFFDIPDENHHITNLVFDNPDLDNSINDSININTNNNLIIFVGPPASGKTKLYNSRFSDYEHINMDTLKTKIKCIKQTEYAMKYKKNIVIDNTNPNMDTRKLYLDLGKKYNYNRYIINFRTNRNINNYYNKYRVQKSKGKIRMIPDVVYNIFYKKYEKPTDDEGTIYNYSNYEFNDKYKF